MQWIDKTDLENWAKRTDARALFVDMVSDLISATVGDQTRFRFLGGGAGEVRGWDGDLEVDVGKGVVPGGKSKWEFGTSHGVAKANADYKKRTDQTPPDVMAENTLVLVNLTTWNTPKVKLPDWEQERQRDKMWKRVRCIDGGILVRWLADHPAIAARYARDAIGSAPQQGALCTDEYWDEFSRQFNPYLSEEAVIGDRRKTADDLLTKFGGPAQSLLLGAESSEEVIAFAVAAIRTAPAPARRTLENKTLIVRTEEAARELSMRDDLVFIVTGTADQLAGRLGEKCPTLSAVTGAQGNKCPQLSRPSATGMAEGLIAMGRDRVSGYELAQRCGRSLTILKRLIPNGPVQPPAWLGRALALKPMFLAGAWSAGSSADRELVGELGGYPGYAPVETALGPTLIMGDRPIDRVGDVCAVRSPVDAFYFYGSQVTAEDLARFQNAVVKVFGRPAMESSDDTKGDPARRADLEHSRWLRDGLAYTLLIVATMHDVANLHVAGRTAQQYVDEIVSGLPEWGMTYQSLTRLEDQAPLIAEAAPNPFLKAFESILASSPGELRHIFVDNSDDVFGPTSPHIHLLWALESIAWDPQYLHRAVVVLAKLAALDPTPDSNHVNRPINSLRHILLGWAPNTFARLPQRIACLDAATAASAEIGWQLLVKLLPRPHDSSSSTHRPKLRDLVPQKLEEVTRRTVWDFESAVVARAISLAEDDEDRLAELVAGIGALRPESRTAVLAHLDLYLSLKHSEEGCAIWHQLKDEVARHEFFGDAGWSLRGADLGSVKDVVERHRPTDPLVSDRHLFDDWTPHVGKYTPGSDQAEDPEELRVQALQRVLSRDGIPGVLRLVRLVKLPTLVGLALRSADVDLGQLLELLEGALAVDVDRSLAVEVSAIGVERFGLQWRDALRDALSGQHLSDPERARLFAGWPSTRETWSYVNGFGVGVSDHYWKHEAHLPRHATVDELLFAVSQFQRHDRHLDVIATIPHDPKVLPTPLMLDLLGSVVKQLGQSVGSVGNMLPYYVEKTLAELRSRSDASEEAIARLEYAYLPIMRIDYQPTTLVALMARDPEVFFEILTHVYAGEETHDAEVVTDAMKARARNSYELLMLFRSVPGLKDGRVDQDVLMSWVNRVRALASQRDLKDECHQQIGAVLAHAPGGPDGDCWPPDAICHAIEAIASEMLEHGFAIECYNKRGVFRKALEEGGNQERELAARYQGWSESVVQHPRTSALLGEIARSWTRSAGSEDIRAEQRMLRS